MEIIKALFGKNSENKSNSKSTQVKKIEANFQLETFILEPILTPSGILDGGDDIPDVVTLEIDLDTVVSTVDIPESLDVNSDEIATNDSMMLDDIVDISLETDLTDTDIEPIAFIGIDDEIIDDVSPSVEQVEIDTVETVEVIEDVHTSLLSEVNDAEEILATAVNETSFNADSDVISDISETDDTSIITTDSENGLSEDFATTENIDQPIDDNSVGETELTPIELSTPSIPETFTFDSGVFTVGNSGKVDIDFLFDGGKWEGEVAIFSLEGMENIDPSSPDFIQEAAGRALSNSELGHVVIFDRTEGARFTGTLGVEPQDWNSGIYQGVKSFELNPGDDFAVMLVPNGTVQKVFNNPGIGGNERPLFSLATANPNDAFHLGQIADVTGDGSTFVMEDMRLDDGSDRDYNDFVFQVRGATGTAAKLDEIMNPKSEWRDSDLGQALIEYAKPYVMPENPAIGEEVSDELIDLVFGSQDKKTTEVDNTEVVVGSEVNSTTETENLVTPETVNSTENEATTVTVGESVASEGEITEAIASTTTETNSASNTQPTVGETVANESEEIGTIISTPQETNSASTTEFTVKVDDWVEQAKKDLAAVINQGNADLDNFQSELTNINNSLSDLAVNLAGEINTANNNTFNQLYDTWSTLDQNQTNLNQLWETIASADQKTVDQVNSLWSEIKRAQDTFNTNPLHTSIQNANSEMYRYYTDTWYALYPNRGLYPDTWSQVESLYNYHKQAVDQYNALINQSDAVFDNAWNEYLQIGDFRQTAINNAISEYSTIATQLNDSWNQYSELQNNRDIIFNDAWSDYYDLNQQRWQFVDNAWNEHNALKNSWNDWGSDSEAQIETWAKILKSEDRWYNPADNPPKSGLPLIGIIDTGFSADHSDIDGSRITLGKDWVDGDTNPLLQPGEGDEHGSKILEIIAGTRKNDIGIDGINDRSPLWLGRAVGSDDWAQSLIEYVDTVKASGESNALVNLSFDLTQTNADGSITTRYELTALERAALTYAQQNNVLIVTATGNQGSTMSALGEAVKEFDNIITVGAAEDWNRADYSSYGEVDYANYGKGVDLLAQGTASNGISGTSVAAAKVTGAASLLWSANPNLNYTQIIDILKRTATDLNTPGWDTQTGLGLLNIAAAVHLAKATEPEVYTPPSFELVQDTLKNSNIPEVYWPEFYNYYYYSDLEAKLTGSVWNGAADAMASERATNITRKEVFRALPYFRTGLPRWLPDWVTGDAIFEFEANREVGLYQASHPLPTIDGQSYSHYEIVDEPLRWSGWAGSITWGGIKKVILVTNEDLKRQLEQTKVAKDAAQAQVNQAIAKLEAKTKEAQQEDEKLKEQLLQRQERLKVALEKTNGEVTPEIIELQKLVDAIKAEIAQHQKESDAEIAALKRQLEEAKKNLEEKTKEYEAAVAAAKAWQQKELERMRREEEAAKKGFWDRLRDSVKGFVKDIGEGLKSTFDKIDVGAVLDVLKKIPVVGTIVNGIEALIALVQGDWIEVVKSGINGALNLIGVSFPGRDTVINILANVGWAIVNKDYKQGLKNILEELANTEKRKKIANVFVEVAWDMKDGDWKKALSAGLSGVGFDNANKFVDVAWAIKNGDYKEALSTGLSATGFNKANEFVDIAWALKDGKYDQALKAGLSATGFYKANEFVDIAWAIKDGKYEQALKAGLSTAGFAKANDFVDIAWVLKDGKYEQALKAGLSTAGFAKANDFVNLAWTLKDGDYRKALSVGLETAGLGNGGAFVGNVFDAITADYSLPGQPIDPANIPAIHQLYEYLARGIAYEDPKVAATPEQAFNDDSLLGNKLAVGEKLLNSGNKVGYRVDKVISDPSTGFYAVGLVSIDGSKPPVLAVRGTGGSPTESTVPALLIDVLEDTNPISIGYNQFQANKAEIEAWLTAQNQQGFYPDIVGHSLGGALAQTITAEFADKVGETVTFNSPGIDDAIALKFTENGGEPKNVTHYIVSGDIIQMAGEKFLPGQVIICAYSNPLIWQKHRLSVLNSGEIKGEQKASGVKFSSISAAELSSPAFVYKDLDYSLFLAAVGLVSPYVSTSLSTRGTTEVNRKAIGTFLNSSFQTIESWVDTAWSIKEGDYLEALSTSFNLANFKDAQKWIEMVQSVQNGKYLEALSTGFDLAKFQDGKNWVDMAWSLQQGDYLKALSTGFEVAKFQDGKNWIDMVQSVQHGDYLKALSTGFKVADFSDGQNWIDMVKSVQRGNINGYLNALSTGFEVAKFQDGKDWVNMVLNLQQEKYLDALSTGFKVAKFSEGEQLVKAAKELREGDYLDAFFAGMQIVPGVGDLVNAFQAIGDMNLTGVAKSLAKVADNDELLKLLIS